MKRKLFLGLGTVASIAAPIVAVVSCGDEVISGKMSWNRSDKEVLFNLSGDAPSGAFAAYGTDFDGLKALDADFATIINQNNVRHIAEGEMVKATFFLGFKEKKAVELSKTSITADVIHKVKVTVNFKYHAKHAMGAAENGNGTTALDAPEYKGFKTNLVEVIAKALTAANGLGKTVPVAKIVASTEKSGDVKRAVQHIEMAAFVKTAPTGSTTDLVITEAQFKAIVVNYTAK